MSLRFSLGIFVFMLICSLFYTSYISCLMSEIEDHAVGRVTSRVEPKSSRESIVPNIPSDVAEYNFLFMSNYAVYCICFV